jgi:hypothetical protein
MHIHTYVKCLSPRQMHGRTFVLFHLSRCQVNHKKKFFIIKKKEIVLTKHKLLIIEKKRTLGLYFFVILSVYNGIHLSLSRFFPHVILLSPHSFRCTQCMMHLFTYFFCRHSSLSHCFFLMSM